MERLDKIEQSNPIDSEADFFQSKEMSPLMKNASIGDGGDPNINRAVMSRLGHLEDRLRNVENKSRGGRSSPMKAS